MPEAAAAASTVARPVPRPAPIRQDARRPRWLLERPLLTVGLALVIIIVATAAIAPLLPLRDPNVTAPARRLAGAGVSGYLLGSDQLGRDLLSRLLWGARVSISVAAVAASVAFLAGGGIGLVSGFCGGLVDNV